MGEDLRGAGRASSAASRRLRRVQGTALLLLIASGMVNYIDRATLAFANRPIRHDLGLGVQAMGWLLSAFLWAYAVAQLPAGVLIDRFGPRRVLSAGLLLWSAAEAAAGLARGFAVFFALRMLLGLGEAPQSPSSARVVRDWFAPARRGAATGAWNCSSTLGTAVAGPLVTALMLGFGWRATFAIMGVAGAVLAFLFFALHRDPRDVVLTAAERSALGGDDEPAARVTWADWRELARARTTWGMIAGFFGAIYVLWVYNAWLPGYLEADRHMSIARTGWVASVPALFGVGGSFAGGFAVDALLRRGLSPIDSRRIPTAICLGGTAAATAAGALAASDAVAIGAISLAMFLLYAATSTSWAMPAAAAPGHVTASLGALQNFGGYVGGALAPVMTGTIVARTGSFELAFLTGAAIAAAAAILHLVLVRGLVALATPARLPC